MASLRQLRHALAPAARHWFLKSGASTAWRAVAPSRDLGILRYHAVVDPATCWYASPGICLGAEQFETQVRYLAANYRVLPLPEAVAARRRGVSLPTNALALTFDDGYADNLDAARVLHRHGLTATFYITAACIGGEEPFWPSEVRYLLSRLEVESAELSARGRSIELGRRSGQPWTKTSRAVNALFKSVTIPEREALRERLRSLVAADPMPSPMLTWDQVREMHAMGMTIGSHTMTHPNLPSAGLADARRELAMSKERLEAAVRSPVTMLSYPNGGAERYETAEIRTLAKELGYEAATTSANGFTRPGSDPFALERLQVGEQLSDLVFGLEVERFFFKPAGRSDD